jgi:hypothetical protein
VSTTSRSIRLVSGFNLRRFRLRALRRRRNSHAGVAKGHRISPPAQPLRIVRIIVGVLVSLARRGEDEGKAGRKRGGDRETGALLNRALIRFSEIIPL